MNDCQNQQTLLQCSRNLSDGFTHGCDSVVMSKLFHDIQNPQLTTQNSQGEPQPDVKSKNILILLIKPSK